MRFDFDYIFHASSPFEDYAEGSPKIDKYFLARQVVLKGLHRVQGDNLMDCGSYWTSFRPNVYYDPEKDAFLDIETDEIATNSAESAGPGFPLFDTLDQLKQYVAAAGSG